MSAFRPVLVREVELSEPVAAISAPPASPASPASPAYESALVLARWHSEPIGVMNVPLADGGVSGDALRTLLCDGLAAELSVRLAEPSPYLSGRAAALAAAPPATVIVCTRDRCARLAACLDAVAALEYPDFEVIVVDNAPADDSVASLVDGRSWPVPLRRVVEPRPGLAWARNAGLRAAKGQIVAYLDDDEWPDRHWLAELARGFTLADGVAGVSGSVLPATLDTAAQCLFERFGGHSKGRGFTPEIFDTAAHARQHPLYPLPPFGVGASMAFDRSVLDGIGGFDVALGAGTPAPAGEDTAAICDLMLSGATFVYWPGAIMWHSHRRTMPELERQLFGYGAGLTAFYLRTLLRNPRLVVALARLAPRALRELRGRGPVSTATMGAGYPASLRRATRRGMLAGPWRYLRSRRVQLSESHWRR